LPIHSSGGGCGAADAAAEQRSRHTTAPVSAALQRGCVGRHLANRNKMRVSGSNSYVLLFFLNQS